MILSTNSLNKETKRKSVTFSGASAFVDYHIEERLNANNDWSKTRICMTNIWDHVKRFTQWTVDG